MFKEIFIIAGIKNLLIQKIPTIAIITPFIISFIIFYSLFYGDNIYKLSPHCENTKDPKIKGGKYWYFAPKVQGVCLAKGTTRRPMLNLAHVKRLKSLDSNGPAPRLRPAPNEPPACTRTPAVQPAPRLRSKSAPLLPCRGAEPPHSSAQARARDCIGAANRWRETRRKPPLC